MSGRRVVAWAVCARSLSAGLVALVSVACGSSPGVDFRAAPGFEGKTFGARGQPADVSQMSESALLADGYVQVGTVFVRHEEGESHGRDPTSEARSGAAAQGGDAIILKRDNQPMEETRYRNGRCLHQSRQQQWVNDYETVCDYSVRPPACSQRQTGGHMESQTVCDEWEQVAYTVRSVVTEGKVFRRDPLLMKEMSGRMLIGAIQSGQTSRALEMIAQGADLNARAMDGTTALSAAVEKGDGAVVSRLLQKHVAVDAPGKGGETPLACAAENGRTALVRQLLSAGADAKGERGAAALLSAAAARHTEIARLLMDHGARLDSSEAAAAVRTAAKDGDANTVRLFLDMGADANSRSGGGYTALMGAAQGGHTAVVRLLLARGASVKAKNGDNGYTALFYAVENGSAPTVQALIAAGADVNARAGTYGKSVLQLAATKQYVDIVRILRAGGATR